MELSGLDCPWYDDWFLGVDPEMCDWDFGTGDVFGEFDQEFCQKVEIAPRREGKIFRPFLSLTAVESVVPAMNAVVNKRMMM